MSEPVIDYCDTVCGLRLRPAALVPFSADQEAWLQGQLDFVQNLSADEEPSDAPVAPARAPVVFLDLDDVVCL